MSFTPDHSGNLPHEFTVCVDCGRKGVYRIAPQVLRVEHGEVTDWRYESWRCKYCGWASVLTPRG